MDIGSAFVGALVAAPLSGVVGTWVGAVMSRREHDDDRRRADVDRAADAVRALRSAYRRVHEAADAPEPVVVADLEDEVAHAAGFVNPGVAGLASRYVDSGRRYAARVPGSSAVERAAFDAVFEVLNAIRRRGRGRRTSVSGGRGRT